MYSLLLVAFSAFALAFLLTPLVRNLSLRLGLVDRPDDDRKLHLAPIPRTGGVPILIASLAAWGILFLSPLQGGNIAAQALPIAWKLLPSCLLVFATGLLDDLVGLRPWQKLLGEIAAAALACWAGVHITIGSQPFAAWWGVPLTILWLVGCANAFNLIDGIDGLATGVGLFATFTILLAALLGGNIALALATAPLAGALLGFLRYNFNPASIFLGDSGSLSIGFLLGCYGVIWSQKTATILGLTAPLMALAVPLLDTAIAIARRVLRRQPIFNGDRGHIHHRLLARGFTPRRAALLLYGVCGCAAAFSLLLSVAPNSYSGAVILLFCASAWIGVQHLGYVEFGVAGRLILPSNFLRVVNAQLRLRAFEESIAAAASIEDCWCSIRDAARDLGFSRALFFVDGGMFEAELQPPGGYTWTISVPLNLCEHITLEREFEAAMEPMVVTRFADALKRSLEARLPAIRPVRELAFSASAASLR